MDELITDFITETREGLEALDSELVRFEQNPEDPELLSGIFRLVHTIKGTCGFLGLMRLQTVAHTAENVLGAFRDGELAVTPEAVSAILDTVDLIRSLIDDLAASGAEPAGDDGALIARLEAVLKPAPEAGEETPSEPAAEPADASAERPLIERLGGDATLDAAAETTLGALHDISFGDLFVDIDPDRLQGALREGLCAAARGSGGAEDFAGRIAALKPEAAEAAVIERVKEHLVDALDRLEVAPSAIEQLIQRLRPGVETPEPAASAPAEAAAPAPAATNTSEPSAVAQTIRVSVDALEHLMTVVSELVLIRNQLIQTLRLEPESAFAAPLNRLNQVTSELQEGVMTTRMQPISGAWAKLPRLVRDLAQDLGKKIDLVMSGQETELDRQVLEMIKDPLTHMIRNAADHGLETPDQRRGAGKAETGRILLSARHEGGAIVIEVADDGRGLPVDRIRAKAAAQGLAPAAQIEAMSDADVLQFIFAPGVSTAGEVTSVSGRGVGMDVVRTNIEKIGGVIELASAEGAGTTFTIRIPLTLTIVSALIVECCGERFAMPQSSVVELVSASGSGRQIEYLDGSAVLRLRDRLLPLVSLQSLLGLEAEQATRGETCIVVAKVGGYTFGVIVDRVFDTEEIVVKPVASVLRHLKVYSGATILGDGSVILILDFKGMSAEIAMGQGATTLVAEDTTAVQKADDAEAVLVFRAANDALKAAPLARVARIEEITPDQIENVDRRSVIQYRGRLMPVISSGGDVVAWPKSERRPLLVFARGEEAIGLLVNEIVDIVDSSISSELAPAGPGAAGSLVIAGAATELIDIAYYWDRADGEIRIETAPPKAPAAKRLLVVDESPFSHLLLRSVLAQAGYDVTIAETPEAALALHDQGEAFDLILADTTTARESARRMAQVLAAAQRWHATPLMGLGFQKLAAAGQVMPAQGAAA